MTATTTGKTPIPTRNDLLQAALELASMGYLVFPCIPNNKEPATEHGFKDASTDEEKIVAWWTDRGDANIGIATESLVVLDVDKDSGGPENPWLAALSQEQLADLQRAPLARTPRGGRHYVFRQNGRRVPSSTAGVAEHIDIRADGGYIVAAPSYLNCVKDGKRIRGSYAWAVALEPVTQLPPVPTWLETLAIEQPSKRGPTAKPKSGTAADGTIPSGQRNELLSRFAYALRKSGASVDEIFAALQVRNYRCDPPLAADELDCIAKGKSGVAPDVQEGLAIGAPKIVCLADVEPQEVKWLWPGKIPMGKLSLCAGDPGLGKTLSTLDMAARVSRGFPWPDDPHSPSAQGSALIISCEDDAADTIRPRLDAASADVSKVHLLRAVAWFDTEKREASETQFSLTRDIETLKRALDTLPDCRLVVIDPVSAYLGEADSHKNAEVRAVLSPLAELAQERGVAVLCVNHLNKGGGAALYRSMGSIGFVAAVRSAWAFTRDKDDPGRKLMLPLKNNLAKDSSGLAFRVLANTAGQPYLSWDPTPINVTADEAMAHDEPRRSDTSGKQEAVDWLQATLADGPVESALLVSEARKIGISTRAINSAKVALGVSSYKEGFGKDGKWMCHLAPTFEGEQC